MTKDKATMETEVIKAERMQAMKAEVQAYETEQAQKRDADVKEQVKTVRDFANSSELKKAIEAAEAARKTVFAFPQIAGFLDNFINTAKILPAAIDRTEAEIRGAMQDDVAVAVPPVPNPVQV